MKAAAACTRCGGGYYRNPTDAHCTACDGAHHVRCHERATCSWCDGIVLTPHPMGVCSKKCEVEALGFDLDEVRPDEALERAMKEANVSVADRELVRRSLPALKAAHAANKARGTPDEAAAARRALMADDLVRLTGEPHATGTTCLFHPTVWATAVDAGVPRCTPCRERWTEERRARLGTSTTEE